MWEQGSTAGKPYRKSARIVGDVMVSTTPRRLRHLRRSRAHGAAVLDGPYARRCQGNFGSWTATTPRRCVTECRLARLTEEMLGTISAKRPSTGRRLRRPQRACVLPSKFPNLLVNGSPVSGGMATNIPPHNSVSGSMRAWRSRATRDRIDELIKLIPGPDFPTVESSVGRPEYASVHEGHGSVQMQARPESSTRRKASESPSSSASCRIR